MAFFPLILGHGRTRTTLLDNDLIQSSFESSTMVFTGIPKVLPFFYMTTKTDLWLQIHGNTVLLEAVASSDLTEVASMHALRKQWSVDEISIAASIIDARKRAKNKLLNADSILSDSVGVQQATSTAIAVHKAVRFQGNAPVFDLCCGIGSDLHALPQQAVGVDHDHVRCVMAQHNSGKKTLCEDILALDVSEDYLVHIDPSRRNDSQRLHGIEEMQPSLQDLSHIIKRCAGGCIKVSPSVDAAELDSFPIPFELEYIEELGRVVQSAIWFGALAINQGKVTASSISLGKSISGIPEHASYSDALSGWLLEPNPALERSGLHCNLATEAGAHALAAKLRIVLLHRQKKF